MKILRFLYQWLVIVPVMAMVTVLAAVTTIVGCFAGSHRIWGYYPGLIWSRIFCIVSLVRVKVRGRENLDKHTSYVFVANHQGAYDIFLVYGYLGHKFKWMMKASLRKIPFVGAACRPVGKRIARNAGCRRKDSGKRYVARSLSRRVAHARRQCAALQKRGLSNSRRLVASGGAAHDRRFLPRTAEREQTDTSGQNNPHHTRTHIPRKRRQARHGNTHRQKSRSHHIGIAIDNESAILKKNVNAQEKPTG